MNKYRPITIKTESGEEIDRAKVVFIPKEENGKFRTTDGTLYERDAKGCIRKKGIKTTIKI